MAPETYVVFLTRSVQACETSPAVDVYAFGVILWELLADWTVPSAIDSSEMINALPQYARNVASTLSPLTLETLRTVWEYPPLHHIPQRCPAALLGTAQRCWSYAESERPTFAVLAEELLLSCLLYTSPSPRDRG